MMVAFQMWLGNCVSGCESPLIFFSQALSCWWTHLGDLRGREPTSSYLSLKKMIPTALIFTILYPARVMLLLVYSMSTWRSTMGLWGILSGIYLETQHGPGIGQNWPLVLSGLTFTRYAISFHVLMYHLSSQNTVLYHYQTLYKKCWYFFIWM